ncbi:hypothetical protein [Leifsonia sp. PS1209]|uniref:phosphoribosyltransferase-like protein n=1 Tax=Leifsonia sp. PS1209 TaxID=2724914 RepID=UPI001442E226|nr:hypothetical protein [Leifsonia sp. PS1209]QIZ99876.1 hypothetical protein HF024_16110 [Leifsonia sp. PS1209]
MPNNTSDARDLYLRVLGDIMGWDDDRARSEYRWLKLMAEMKYDAYRDFQAGMRFIESLARWLQQFAEVERAIAYDFVRERLVFIGLSETQHLVEQFYPAVAHARFIEELAGRREVLPYKILTSQDWEADVERLRRRSLFLGLSDGARIDVLRHSNPGRLSNEQVVGTTQVDQEKWRNLLSELREDTKDPEAKFEMVFLIDDFTATGTSFLRYDEDKKKWKGKLHKFMESISMKIDNADGESIQDALFADGWKVHVHHYMASTRASQVLEKNFEQAADSLANATWTEVRFTYGYVFPENLPVSVERGDGAFIELTKTHYNEAIETRHSRVGGVKHLGLGYGACALPVVLEHNTPNNSIALLWAEHKDPKPSMTPLFRRRQRHL